MVIRTRRSDDIEALCDLARVVHETDGYPVRLQDDVRSFVVTENCLAAWVCEQHGRIVGHIALHTVWSDVVAELAASSLGRTRNDLASVSRFFVDSAARSRGVGGRLFAVATAEAYERGLWPVLDVVTTYAPAVALYERRGWNRLGTIAEVMPNGRRIDEYVYAAPSPQSTG